MQAAAPVDPGVLLTLVHAKRNRRIKGEGLVLANEVIARSVRALHGALLHCIDGAESRHDFTRTKHPDLEFVVGDGGNALGNHLGTTVNGVQTLRKT